MCQEGCETLKDHPIRRARDLKPVQFVVAHLKTLFSFMTTIPFKTTIKNNLIISARKYYSLLDKKIILSSPSFMVKQEYALRFYETNFLHLAGVKTSLSPLEFFNRW